MKNNIYASLDIGTTSIKVIVAELMNGQLNVIGVGNERSNGLSRGMIIDIDETALSIQKAVKQAEEKADIEIDHLIVGVPAMDVQISPAYGSISLDNNQKEIEDKDVQKIIKKTIEDNIASNREVIDLSLDEFSVDGFNEIKDPRGMIGNRIEFRGVLTTIPRTIFHNIYKSVQRSGYGIENIILQPHAMSNAALNSDEKNFGSVLIDMGGGQTNVSVIHENKLKFSEVIQEGGEYISKDISIVLNTSIKNAEKLKRDVGYAYSAEANSDRIIPVEVVGQQDLLKVNEEYISEIIEARLDQIFQQLRYATADIGANNLPAGIILSGGSASFPGIERLAEEIFNMPARVYVPDFMGIRYPAFTNAIGLVISQTDITEIETLITQTIFKAAFNDQLKNNHNIDEIETIQDDEKNLIDDIETINKPSQENEPSFLDKIKIMFEGFFE